MDYLSRILKREMAVPLEEGADKSMRLDEAVDALVRPGMTLHAAITHGRPNAAVHEIVRQYWGKDPGFALSTLGFGYNWVVLVHGSLVRSVASSFIGDPYPTPGPNPVFAKAYREGPVVFENWSILSLTLRLLAGAMGLPFLPTRSLVGSTMAQDNAEHFFIQKTQQGQTLGMVRALEPDLCIVHGLAADRQGNTILTPPGGDGVYGAMAARRGALVTVEKIVSTDFIRRHSHLVKLPGRFVSAVCEVPFGAHPSGVSNHQGVPGVFGYADDYAFIENVRQASRDEKVLDQWVDDWILQHGGHGAYLERLGSQRQLFLKGKADGDSWMPEIQEHLARIEKAGKANRAERLVSAAGRKLAQIVADRRYDTILAGVGFSNLAAWLAARKVKAAGAHVDLMAELGFFGYHPRPADPFIFNYRNIPTCVMLTDIFHVMGIFLSGAHNRCVGAFGAAQIDKQGNVNSTLIPGKTFFVGSGGANDVACGASESLVTMIQKRDRMVKKVPYITSPGKKIRTLITTLGIYEKRGDEDELILTGVLGDGDDSDLDALVRKAKEACSWELKVADKVQVVPPPDPDDLALLRLWDPKGQFLEKTVADQPGE